MIPRVTILLTVALGSWTAGARAEGPAPLRQVAVIALPGAEKRIDHLALDSSGLRLFVSALGSGSLEVVDLESGRRVRSVPGFREPQGVAYLPAVHKVVVASAGGDVVVLDDASFKQLVTFKSLDDADNLRFDAGAHRLYVGYGDGALAVFDPVGMKRLADIKLPGHPESFQIEESGTKIYVNLPRTSEVLVVDKRLNEVVSRMALGAFAKNYPMSLDEARHRLFVGTRQPPRVVVLDTRTGHPVANVPCVGDTDDLFYDAERNRIYVVGGEGFIDVLDGREGNRYPRLARLTTSPGARTGLWSRERQQLFVAVPHRDGHEAAVHVYAPDLNQQ
jgi:DNA-binding beta-propeller fold protein YncE